MWDKIAAALDESHIKLMNSLQHYIMQKLMPPASAWDKIASVIGSMNMHPVDTRCDSKSFSFFRYAAAAVVIGLVAIGSY